LADDGTVSHPFFDAARFPDHREDARALRRALTQARPEPPRYKLLYTNAWHDAQELTPNQAADLAWGEILQNLTAARRLERFCEIVLADESLRNVHPFVRAVQHAAPVSPTSPQDARESATSAPEHSGRQTTRPPDAFPQGRSAPPPNRSRRRALPASIIAAVITALATVLAALIGNWSNGSEPSGDTPNGAAVDPKPLPLIVAGEVFDEAGTRIAGSTVSIQGRHETDTTGSNGRFRFELPVGAPDRVRLKTTSAGFTDDVSETQVPNERVQIQLTRVPRGQKEKPAGPQVQARIHVANCHYQREHRLQAIQEALKPLRLAVTVGKSRLRGDFGDAVRADLLSTRPDVIVLHYSCFQDLSERDANAARERLEDYHKLLRAFANDKVRLLSTRARSPVRARRKILRRVPTFIPVSQVADCFRWSCAVSSASAPLYASDGRLEAIDAWKPSRITLGAILPRGA
jgi:hypothetical protein